ncbi:MULTISPECIES: hypothetical protein [Sorangium]|uniref:Uncharacterized protein n=1 Tax=Sorangium cellulosum TaxID=56 RepID=A0A4V0NHB9_SORCE|nr:MULTISPECIES: hypothetical protein [Sorangium]AUX36132.1 hypothetical protein SOCE836_083380 [Sorangium cellulosum]WCQ95435.1 hypothetical protein NQZ70_08211 [Sorangium sp. Soce836]
MPSIADPKPLIRRSLCEASLGQRLFSTRDPETWTAHFEALGTLCADAWLDDLPEADRAWAAAHRERFRRWIDVPRPNGADPRSGASALQSDQVPVPGELTLPWPMLLGAVESAFFASVRVFEVPPARERERAAADAAARLHRSYLWRTLSSDAAAAPHRPEALRAFQRGFELGRGTPSSRRMPVPPMLEPPWYWGAGLPEYPGPIATRERALRTMPISAGGAEWLSRNRELRALYASAWRGDVPEEDREWAQVVRDCCTTHVNRRRRDAIACTAYESYLQSSGGLFDGEPGRPWPQLTHATSESWRAFADRVEDAPEGEGELATAEAAARELWETLYAKFPPWDSAPDQAHWLAAVRAARAKALAGDAPPEQARWPRESPPVYSAPLQSET